MSDQPLSERVRSPNLDCLACEFWDVGRSAMEIIADEIAALEQERERLRTALERIASGEGPYDTPPLDHPVATVVHLQDIARVALEGGE